RFLDDAAETTNRAPVAPVPEKSSGREVRYVSTVILSDGRERLRPGSQFLEQCRQSSGTTPPVLPTGPAGAQRELAAALQEADEHRKGHARWAAMASENRSHKEQESEVDRRGSRPWTQRWQNH